MKRLTYARRLGTTHEFRGFMYMYYVNFYGMVGHSSSGFDKFVCLFHNVIILWVEQS